MKQGEECRDRKNGSRGVVLMERLLGACSRGFEESSAAVVRVARQRSKERARGNIQRLFQVGRIIVSIRIPSFFLVSVMSPVAVL